MKHIFILQASFQRRKSGFLPIPLSTIQFQARVREPSRCRGTEYEKAPFLPGI